MTHVRLIVEAEALAELAPQWDGLWRRSPGATPFQSPAWLLAWWRAFSPGELRCAAAFADQRLVALLPFYLEREGDRARLLPIGISLSDYLDILVDPHHADALTPAVACLCDGDWREWRCEALAPGAQALQLPTPPGVVESTDEQEPCPVVELGADFCACVPARQRRKLRRALAAAERRGHVTIAAGEDSGGFLDVLFALHARRWAQRGEPGVLGDPRVQAFHRAALPALSAAGLARTFTVRIDGAPAGVYYGYADAHRAYAYLGGFDPALEDASPGALAIEAAMRAAIAEGAQEFHFLRGREAYKYAWGAVDRRSVARIWTRDHV